jgi:putative intracellular protease/amidase
MHFQILIFDGFDELDAIAPFEVLQDAIRAKEGDRVESVTVEAAVA